MIDTKLIILFAVCIIFMVYLGVEGFAQYQSYSDRLAAQYGLVKSFNYKTSSDVCGNEIISTGSVQYKTASDFPNLAAYKTASEWQAQNMGGQVQNIYQMLSPGTTTRDDIRKMITDMSASGSGKPVDKRWLTYYDATDYTASNPEKKTGSRWNETSYIDTVNYDRDASGGRHLIQCAPNDFNCIRLLGYSDPSYQPYQGDTAWPTAAPSAPTTQPAPALNTTSTNLDCIVKCLNNYGGAVTADRIKACSTLCM